MVPVAVFPGSRGAVLFTAIMMNAFAGCVGSSDQDLSISIQSPDDGAVVAADTPVVVEFDLTGATITSEGAGHVHVMVDGEVESMINSASAEVTIDEGDHVIMAEYVDAKHEPFDPRVTDSIEVRAR